jgi:hypothetical protein
MRALATALTTALAVAACHVPGDHIAAQSPSRPATTEPDVSTNGRHSGIRAEGASRPSDRARLAQLKTKFIFESDQIYGGGTYTHRNQTAENSFRRSYLAAPVSSSGSIHLLSFYSGDDWIFHDHVVVRVGEAVYTSDAIPSYAKENARSNVAGLVFEVVAFTDHRDNGILEAIARDPRQVVRVRFAGRFSEDIVLSRRDKIALAESVELAELLRKVAN